MHYCTRYAPDSSIHVFNHPFLPLFDSCDFDLQPTENVLNGTFPPQGQQLCQIVLKSMHYCTLWSGQIRTDARTH